MSYFHLLLVIVGVEGGYLVHHCDYISANPYNRLPAIPAGWSQCSAECGGGSRELIQSTYNTYCQKQVNSVQQREACNEICYNGGTFVAGSLIGSGSCQCQAGYYGRCCLSGSIETSTQTGAIRTTPVYNTLNSTTSTTAPVYSNVTSKASTTAPVYSTVTPTTSTTAPVYSTVNSTTSTTAPVYSNVTSTASTTAPVYSNVTSKASTTTPHYVYTTRGSTENSTISTNGSTYTTVTLESTLPEITPLPLTTVNSVLTTVDTTITTKYATPTQPATTTTPTNSATTRMTVEPDVTTAQNMTTTRSTPPTSTTPQTTTVDTMQCGDSTYTVGGGEIGTKVIEEVIDTEINQNATEDMNDTVTTAAPEAPFTQHDNYTCFQGDNETTQTVKDASMYTHNKLRVLHGVPCLTWDYDLARKAQMHADWMAANQLLDHSDTKGLYGENIGYMGITRKNVVVGPAPIIRLWYNEILTPGWNFTTHTAIAPGVYHFTQLVWKGTTSLGCAVSTVVDVKWQYTYLCCQYLPAGNVRNRYDRNVLPPNIIRKVSLDEVNILGTCDYFSKCGRFSSSCSDSYFQSICGLTCTT